MVRFGKDGASGPGTGERVANELSGKSILVVDDEADLRSIISEDLEMLGAEVFQATNGRSAFDLFQRHRQDAIVSDVRMPGGDGVELARNVRAAFHPMPCFVFITGFADITPEQVGAIGVHGMLYKPFSLKELRALLIEGLGPRGER